ncbi:MAG: hypothetical protein IKD93_01930 [Firmicutes bacterium]|nr:hypothetical protein [Bacillota bacterium]
MNYISLLNAFWQRQLIDPIPAKAVALYLAVLQCANRAGWPDGVTVSISTLMILAQLSKSDFYRVRKVLIKAGLIRVKNGKKGQSATYTLTCIIPKYGSNSGTHPETNPGTYTGNIYKQDETKQGAGPAVEWNDF